MLVALAGVPARARSHHGESWARERFATAERMQEALNGRPPGDRTRRDYQRVLNAYRNVYYGAPTSSKADPSVVAVAETLVEMGRRFDDAKILNEAIAQYKFLRREYPGSKYRCDALFTIGEIYEDDLNDPEQARATFEEFLRRYPHNRLVEDAQQAIVELDRQAEAEKREEAEKKTGKEATAKSANAKESSGPEGDAHAEPPTSQASSERPSGRLPRVTGIRHWSTPDYTRVAIDLESEVKFASQRIADPDRIFFDLRDTKLASTLVGKSFDVDDGFLKKIRVAQFQPGRTRVVLEVDSLSDYDAFLLPNPYRLIVDIHGKEVRGKERKAARAKLAKNAAEDVESAPKAGTKSATAASADLKANVSASAGKTDESGNDEAETPAAEAATRNRPLNAALKRCATQNPASSAPCPAVHTTVDPKTGVKKVIVEAEDDDSSPVEVAKVEVAVKRGTSPSVDSDKADDTANSDSSGPEEKLASDSPAAIPAKGKSSARLGQKSRVDLDMHEAKPTARGDRSLIRALGLKIGKIVIDPGHGGHDTGTVGANGLEEKDLVLDVGAVWASCWRRGWARKLSTRAKTTPSFRWKRARPSPTSSAPTCSSPFTPTRAMTRRRAESRLIT